MKPRSPILSHDEHAAKARHAARAAGAHDCIHFAPSWSSRADALYALANAEYARSGLTWWEGSPGGNPYLLEDGRMVVACEKVWFVELKQ